MVLKTCFLLTKTDFSFVLNGTIERVQNALKTLNKRVKNPLKTLNKRKLEYLVMDVSRLSTVIPLSSYHGLLLVAHLGRMAD
jgi:hypothetical protein